MLNEFDGIRRRRRQFASDLRSKTGIDTTVTVGRSLHGVGRVLHQDDSYAALAMNGSVYLLKREMRDGTMRDLPPVGESAIVTINYLGPGSPSAWWAYKESMKVAIPPITISTLVDKQIIVDNAKLIAVSLGQVGIRGSNKSKVETLMQLHTTSTELISEELLVNMSPEVTQRADRLLEVTNSSVIRISKEDALKSVMMIYGKNLDAPAVMIIGYSGRGRFHSDRAPANQGDHILRVAKEVGIPIYLLDSRKETDRAIERLQSINNHHNRPSNDRSNQTPTISIPAAESHRSSWNSMSDIEENRLRRRGI